MKITTPDNLVDGGFYWVRERPFPNEVTIGQWRVFGRFRSFAICGTDEIVGFGDVMEICPVCVSIH
jgi:hypothetical protein